MSGENYIETEIYFESCNYDLTGNRLNKVPAAT